mmetsp:Transcript_27763/g.33903  ORF Transcript_27763/g.33903 Transcript_27763/m.33903 type:complete len:128 (+) Transcript_27763:52-435(+)
MGLKNIYLISQIRPSRGNARFVLRYLRYYDQRTYRAISKFFQTKYGIQAEEWADSLIDGGRLAKFMKQYALYMPRHDWGRHISILIALALPVTYYSITFHAWYYEDYLKWKLPAMHKVYQKRKCYSE